jgi:WD40 repeat protein
LYWIESEKAREHDCSVTGVDYNPILRIIVTSDSKGVVRLWTREKKFIREILFPTAVDSVCFLN